MVKLSNVGNIYANLRFQVSGFRMNFSDSDKPEIVGSASVPTVVCRAWQNSLGGFGGPSYFEICDVSY